MEGRKCPKCGSYSVQCYHADVGGVEYYDEYTLHCKDCGYIERVGRSGGSPMSDNWVTECPYCGVGCYSHRVTPEGLWGYGQNYKPDYKPLFCFDVHSLLGGANELCIAVKDGKAILVAYGYEGPRIQLDLPVPDDSSLGFKIIESQRERVVIEVTVVTKKRLIVGCEGANLPIAKLEDFQ